MAGHDYDGDQGDDPNNDEYYDSCEEDDIDLDSESDSDDRNGDRNGDPMLNGPWRPVIRWKQLKIGNAILEISSAGLVKPFNTRIYHGEPLATQGVCLPGTPFRTFTVEIECGSYKTYYVHDLVYHAFNGPPPPGYEVRHVTTYTKKARTYYSNRLGCLTIYPTVVSKLVVGAAAIS
jgi:hypothetical protein